MKRIALLSGSCLLNFWNGMGRQTRSLATGLINRGFDVTVFVPSEKNTTYFTQLGETLCKHVAFPHSKNATTLTIEKIPVWNEALQLSLTGTRLDYIVCLSCDSWLAAKNYAASNPSTAVIGIVPFLYSRSPWIKQPGLQNTMVEIEKDYLQNASALTAHTEILASSIAAVSQREVTVIPNATFLPSHPSKLEMQNRLCYIGRINKSKSLETLYRAVARMSVDLVVCSPEVSNTKLDALAKDLKINDRLSNIGWAKTQAVYDLYKSSALAVVCGLNEPYGYGALDPLALGTRTIVSGFSGLSDYLPMPSNSYSNIDELVELINFKLRDKRAEEESRIGIERVASLYDPNVIAKLFEETLLI